MSYSIGKGKDDLTGQLRWSACYHVLVSTYGDQRTKIWNQNPRQCSAKAVHPFICLISLKNPLANSSTPSGVWNGQQFIPHPREFSAATLKSLAIQDDPRLLQSATSPTSGMFALINDPIIRKTGECTPSSALRPVHLTFPTTFCSHCLLGKVESDTTCFTVATTFGTWAPGE